MGERLTRIEAAKRKNVSPQRIGELIAAGKLAEDRSPGAPVATVDADELDQLFDDMDVSRRSRIEITKNAQGKDADPEAEKRSENNRKVLDTLNAARAKDAVMRANARELSYQQAKGKLIDRDNVAQQGYAAGKLFIGKTKDLGRRPAAEVAGIRDVDQVAALLQTNIDRLVQELRDALAGKH